MVQECQGLALSFEASDDLARISAMLDDFQRDLSADGVTLLGDIDNGGGAFADSLKHVIPADEGADGVIGSRRSRWGGGFTAGEVFLASGEKVPGGGVGGQQGLDAFQEFRFALAGAAEEGFALGGLGAVQRGAEDSLLRVAGRS
jgi:hypothetical protein